MGTPRFEFGLANTNYSLAVSPDYFYVMPDGRTASVPTGPAWCDACQTFTVAEHVPELPDLRARVRELEYFTDRPGLIPPDRHIDLAGLPHLRAIAAWRAERVGPARCLACGSTAITMIFPGTTVEVPGRGTCVARFRGWADLVRDMAAQYYTPEGERTAAPVESAVARSGGAS